MLLALEWSEGGRRVHQLKDSLRVNLWKYININKVVIIDSASDQVQVHQSWCTHQDYSRPVILVPN